MQFFSCIKLCNFFVAQNKSADRTKTQQENVIGRNASFKVRQVAAGQDDVMPLPLHWEPSNLR